MFRQVVHGGQADVSKCYIAPTIVRCGPEAKLMKDEIFGPVLPVLSVPDVDKAIEFVNAREKPLALSCSARARSWPTRS